MPADTSGLPGHGLADLFFLDMPDDRRSVRRARLAGVRVTYESASGERKEADVLDLGSGGLFIRTATPIPIGKRLSLEIFVTGEATSWPALGRVLWTREADEGEERPAGMGIKLIDVEDDVIAAIDRLVATRERTEPGVGKGGAPEREKTILGVGVSAEAEPDREPTPQTPLDKKPGAEASIAIDLVAKKPESERPAQAVAEAPTKKRSAGRAAIAFVLLLAVAAVAASMFRERIVAGWTSRFT